MSLARRGHDVTHSYVAGYVSGKGEARGRPRGDDRLRGDRRQQADRQPADAPAPRARDVTGLRFGAPRPQGGSRRRDDVERADPDPGDLRVLHGGAAPSLGAVAPGRVRRRRPLLRRQQGCPSGSRWWPGPSRSPSAGARAGPRPSS
ncbi:hypothetical protein [Nocardioides convexus]|uniref:hypothetical protein n=1 Tax=Nocardioides convexus TaxID=2712224 RepID=UPI00241852EC|nr:hypothetical protein [Nocardioides convexus]